MAIIKEIAGVAQKLAHNITFSGQDLALGGGKITIASKWYVNGVAVSDEEVVVYDIMDLRSSNTTLTSNLDAQLRQLCESIWLISNS